MTAAEQHTKLINLAARMLHSSAGPSPYLEDHEHRPKRVPARWWRWLCGKLHDAEDEHRRWAIELREVADSLVRTQVRHAEHRSAGSQEG